MAAEAGGLLGIRQRPPAEQLVGTEFAASAEDGRNGVGGAIKSPNWGNLFPIILVGALSPLPKELCGCLGAGKGIQGRSIRREQCTFGSSSL